MTTSNDDIKAGLGVLDANDATLWEAPGIPTLAAIRAVTSDDTLTVEQVAEALGLQLANPVPKLAVAADTGADDDRPDEIENPESRRGRILKEATEARAAIYPQLEEFARARIAAEKAIALRTVEIDRLTAIIEENTDKLTDIEMVKRIQKQTQDRLTAQATAQANISDQMKAAGIAKPFASPLDAALAAGSRRSVTLINGEVHVAPHPRSAEGVRNFAQFIHGTRPQA